MTQSAVEKILPNDEWLSASMLSVVASAAQRESLKKYLRAVRSKMLFFQTTLQMLHNACTSYAEARKSEEKRLSGSIKKKAGGDRGFLPHIVLFAPHTRQDSAKDERQAKGRLSAIRLRERILFFQSDASPLPEHPYRQYRRGERLRASRTRRRSPQSLRALPQDVAAEWLLQLSRLRLGRRSSGRQPSDSRRRFCDRDTAGKSRKR